MFQRIWTPVIGEVLETKREPDNKHDKYTVAVLEEQTNSLKKLLILMRSNHYHYVSTC